MRSRDEITPDLNQAELELMAARGWHQIVQLAGTRAEIRRADRRLAFAEARMARLREELADAELYCARLLKERA